MYRIDDIGVRIAAARRRMDMTQGAFAEALGVTPQAVSKWETGSGYPDISMFPDIARILNITMDALFGAEPPAEQTEADQASVAGSAEAGGTVDVAEAAAAEVVADASAADYGSVPPEYIGLGLVAVWGDVVCYSDRSDVEIEGPRVTWGDDSYADLRSRQVVNHGRQTIILLNREAAECLAPKQKSKKPKPGDLAQVLPGDLRGIDLDLSGMTNVRIRAAKEDAKAWSWFYDSSLDPRENIEVEARDGILHVRTLSRGSRRWGQLRKQKDRLLIWVPDAGIETLAVCVRGIGDIDCGVPSGATRVEISGAGDCDLTRCEDLEVTISGAGDVDCDSATSLRAQIRGAGDIDLEEIRGGDIDCRISGAGDVDIDRGTAGHLQLEASGAGEFDAPDLVVDTASIRISGPSVVKLGRIIGRSEEQIGMLGSLRVRSRGPRD
ncbi:MAG: DUF2807 domain-containing protein [Bacillota bacterium]|nr:DUF2807 domain-containing protein [Bacillota bacterium]